MSIRSRNPPRLPFYFQRLVMSIGINEDFEQKIERIVADAFESCDRQNQETFDRVFKTHERRPEGEVREVLREAFARERLTVPPSQMAKVLKPITEGRHILLRTRGITDRRPVAQG